MKKIIIAIFYLPFLVNATELVSQDVSVKMIPNLSKFAKCSKPQDRGNRTSRTKIKECNIEISNLACGDNESADGAICSGLNVLKRTNFSLKGVKAHKLTDIMLMELNTQTLSNIKCSYRVILGRPSHESCSINY